MRYWKPGDKVVCILNYCEFKVGDVRTIIKGSSDGFFRSYGDTKEEHSAIVPYTEKSKDGHIANHPRIREVFKLLVYKNTKPDWL